MAIAGYKHMTQVGAGLKDGTTWANAFDEPAFEAWAEGVPVGSWVVFFMDGVYILDSDINTAPWDGTAVSPIAFIGVKAGTTNEGAAITYDDWSRDAADRPFFDCVTFEFKVGDFTRIENLNFEGADNVVLNIAGYCIVENCKIENDNAVLGVKYALSVVSYSKVYNNEIVSTNNYGISEWTQNIIKYNYIHDCIRGLSFSGGINNTEFNIFSNSEYGIYSGSKHRVFCENNTFYDCDVGIRETDGVGWSIVNNIFVDCVTAPMSWGVQTDSNFIWNNHIHNCGANVNIDETTCFQDYELVIGGPLFTNPGVDFSLQAGSPCLNAGMSEILGVGL